MITECKRFNNKGMKNVNVLNINKQNMKKALPVI